MILERGMGTLSSGGVTAYNTSGAAMVASGQVVVPVAVTSVGRTALDPAANAALLADAARRAASAGVPTPCVLAADAKARSSPAYPNLAAQCAAALAQAKASGTTNATRPADDGDTILGMPRPVAIGAGVAAALGLGLVAYKLTR